VNDQISGVDGGGGVEVGGNTTPPASRPKGTLHLTSGGSLFIYV
jgi:Flp pilus assembly secretin CpaC